MNGTSTVATDAILFMPPITTEPTMRAMSTPIDIRIVIESSASPAD